MPDRELVYNDANRLYQLIEDGTLTTAYLYNDGGQRTRKITYQSDGQTVDTITVYHYDMMGYLVTETTETGALIKDYIWREGMNPVAQIDSSSGAEQVSYLHTDHLMTNRLATNPAQQVIWRWEGEAFGNTPAQELASIQVNLRFPGQYYDAETNLHYNWNRYYDPELGRYITSDPIGLSGGMNTYGYALADPVALYDFDGLRYRPRNRQHRSPYHPSNYPKLGTSVRYNQNTRKWEPVRHSEPTSQSPIRPKPNHDPNAIRDHIRDMPGNNPRRDKTGPPDYRDLFPPDRVVPPNDPGDNSGEPRAEPLNFPDMNSPGPVDPRTMRDFCLQNPGAPNCKNQCY